MNKLDLIVIGVSGVVGALGIAVAAWSLYGSWRARHKAKGRNWYAGYAQCLRDAKRYGTGSPLLYTLPPIAGPGWLDGYNEALKQLGLKEIGK